MVKGGGLIFGVLGFFLVGTVRFDLPPFFSFSHQKDEISDRYLVNDGMVNDGMVIIRLIT